MTYKFAVLDPRPAGTEANKKIFEDAGGVGVLGVEVTVPQLAAQCSLGNIDPQHTGGGRVDRAAIEEALEAPLPPAGATLATVRADLDSVGAMAIFLLRQEQVLGIQLEQDMAYCPSCSFDIPTPGHCPICGWEVCEGRMRLVAESDKFARGPWPGIRPFPTLENPWPSTGAATETRKLAAIAAAVADFRVPLDERVALMRRWLLEGREPCGYRERVELERADMIRALKIGEITVSSAADDRIAVVESDHRAAMACGYARAPVVVARNPAFQVADGEPHVKFTIATYSTEYAEIKNALAELALLESGWGGSPTIGGSPQGVSSTLTTEQVVEMVSRHLK